MVHRNIRISASGLRCHAFYCFIGGFLDPLPQDFDNLMWRRGLGPANAISDVRIICFENLDSDFMSNALMPCFPLGLWWFDR